MNHDKVKARLTHLRRGVEEGYSESNAPYYLELIAIAEAALASDRARYSEGWGYRDCGMPEEEEALRVALTALESDR